MSDLHPGEPLNEHPVAEEIAAYLSGTLLPGSRSIVEQHLVECRACRHEVASARRLLRDHRSPKRVGRLVLASAAILALVVFVRRPEDPTAGGDSLRGDSGLTGVAEAPSIGIVAPGEGETVGRASLVFVWRSQPGSPLYQLTLTDGSGLKVWSAETSDTTLALPSQVSLQPERAYFWIVDGLAADGRSLTTRNHRFVTRP